MFCLALGPSSCLYSCREPTARQLALLDRMRCLNRSSIFAVGISEGLNLMYWLAGVLRCRASEKPVKRFKHCSRHNVNPAAAARCKEDLYARSPYNATCRSRLRTLHWDSYLHFQWKHAHRHSSNPTVWQRGLLDHTARAHIGTQDAHALAARPAPAREGPRRRPRALATRRGAAERRRGALHHRGRLRLRPLAGMPTWGPTGGNRGPHQLIA